MELKTVQEKWVSNWRGHGTLKSIVGHHGWLARKTFKILDALEWLNRQHFDHGDRQSFNCFSFETVCFFPLFPFFRFARQKVERGAWTPPPRPCPLPHRPRCHSLTLPSPTLETG